MSIIGVAIIALVVSIEIWGRVNAKEKASKEQAALRPPPKGPNCPELPHLTDVRLSDGQIADVRIFRFDTTFYYIPSAWLRLRPENHGSVDGVDQLKLGLFDPDVHEDECPGVVHQVTDGGLYIDRHVGVWFKPTVRSTSARFDLSGIFAHKLRVGNELNSPAYQGDGLLESMGHLTLDAYVRPAADVGMRLTWHPHDVTKDTWQDQYRAWSAGPRAKVTPKPWSSVPATDEFLELASHLRRLHHWLMTPPNRRPPEPPPD